MSEQKPEPCPFCGGRAKLQSIQYGWYRVGCTNPFCGVLPQTWVYETAEEAIEAWNRRTANERTD